jgi:hypothetical protein
MKEKRMKAPFVFARTVALLTLLLGFAGGHASAQSNSATTRTQNPDGSTTVTTTTTYKDGSTTTVTTYDKDGHDAGTTRTDVQTKDGETTTTTIHYDGSGHETGRTVARKDRDGNQTVTSYDAQGHEVGTTKVPKEPAKGLQSTIEGVVLPDKVHDKQPFSFAVTDNPAQSEINIQTLNGVVVENHAPDKYGRVFLPAGLPAGAYLISLAKDNKPAGKFEVQPRPTEAIMRTWEHPPLQPQIVNPPQASKVADPLWLSGHGFNPNCTDMTATFTEAGRSQAVPILAATEDQLKLAPVTQLPPGQAQLKVANQATQQSSPQLPILLYDVNGHLERNKLKSGQQTTLVFKSQPADVQMKLHVTIAGKATFSGGRTEIETVIDHGKLTLPVEAKLGSGEFQIDYEGQPAESQRGSCSCGCGGTAQPRCAHKACGCSNAASPSLVNVTDKLSDIGTKPSSGKAKCSCGCGGTAQPRCAHKDCGCSK